MADARREKGLVDTDQCSHIVVPNLSGLAALCGAGKIVQRLPGWFDDQDPLACGDCAADVSRDRQ